MSQTITKLFELNDEYKKQVTKAKADFQNVNQDKDGIYGAIYKMSECKSRITIFEELIKITNVLIDERTQ